MTGGSSPRLRGAPSLTNVASSESRLIPASAGSTVTAGLIYAYTQAHPRVCGEHLGRKPEHAYYVGSSPRLRGAPACWEG